MREQRKLAAVLAADAVGYSRLMGRDEAGTLARLKNHRDERLEPALARNGGRLVKLTGDGVLAEFASAVDALRAALEFQQAVDRANTALPEEQRIVFRVGLHVGDLIVDGDDLYGDGVNIAARLEAEAAPGGIVASGALHDAAAGKLQATFVDLGRLSLKNIERPVQAYRIELGPGVPPVPAPVPSAGGAPLALPDKPSIAVLPFQNMSGDPEQEYFGDGLAEDIITALSRSRDFFVIARNSSFSYKGTSPDIRQVGRELGVRYVLEGSVRKAGNRLRITGQLIEATTAKHVWAERYDRTIDDIFTVQDEITESVVASIQPQLVLAENTRVKNRPTSDLDAWGYVTKAFALSLVFSKQSALAALDMLEHAQRLDPGYARAFADFAVVQANVAYQDWSTDRTRAFSRALEAAQKAVVLDPDDARGHFALGHAALMSRRYDDALPALFKAVELDPNLAVAHARLGVALAYNGQPAKGIGHTERAFRMSPRDPQKHFLLLSCAIASGAAQRYAEAAEYAQRSLQAWPGFRNALRVLVANLALDGKLPQAQAALGELRRVQPEITLEWVDRNLDAPQQIRDHFIRGLRLAGMT